ncbi:MAG: biotin--[acetyl-CoA-carboxylase] ligase [Candidatus Hydrogenedentes bacterium]|nr:biotin--[acetyl-CoA-carboxylase] ligase [Candidatus Hydrogenedentota bacterium]
MAFQFLSVEWHDILPSTNSCLVERVKAAPDTPPGTVIAAREQTAGRGRQQRSWITQPRQNLTFSFLWNTPVPRDHLPAMAQAISVGIAQMLEGQGLRPTIKWPNDVLVNGKKIGGILCERVNTGDPAQTTIVAGIGLNVNMDAEAAARIDQPATSLAIETGHSYSTDDILVALLETLPAPLASWATEGFAGVRTAYVHFSFTPGATLHVRDGARHVEGAFLGFDDDGALLIETKEEGIRTLYSGDVLLEVSDS